MIQSSNWNRNMHETELGCTFLFTCWKIEHKQECKWERFRLGSHSFSWYCIIKPVWVGSWLQWSSKASVSCVALNFASAFFFKLQLPLLGLSLRLGFLLLFWCRFQFRFMAGLFRQILKFGILNYAFCFWVGFTILFVNFILCEIILHTFDPFNTGLILFLVLLSSRSCSNKFDPLQLLGLRIIIFYCDV